MGFRRRSLLHSFTIISLIQAVAVNAAFDGIPLRPGKTQSNNSISGYSGPSILAGLLYPQRRLLDLDVRQQRTCPPGYSVPCPGGIYCCTQAYNKCCGDGTCCPGNSNCYGGGVCCPYIAQTCGGRLCCESGAICCGNPPRGCCDAGMVCCTNRCCSQGESCCGDHCCTGGTICCPGACCPYGTECAGNGQCRFATTSTSSISTNSTITVTATRTTTTRSTSTTSSAATPTMTFVYVPGLTDAICENICLGIRKRKQFGNVDLLTYDPTMKREKRRAAGCVTGHCKTALTGKTCDEYPFASSAEGGQNATIACVPKEQNTDQGIYMKFWFLAHGYLPIINNGKKFGVEVVGLDCDSLSNVSARHNKRAIADSGSNSTVLPGLTFDNHTTGPSSGRVLLPLGDVNAGNYSMSISVPSGSSSIDSLIIVDNEGEQFAQSNSSTSEAQTVKFRLEDDGIGIGMVVFTSQSSLDVSWTISSDASSVVGPSQLQVMFFIGLILYSIA